MTVNLLPIKIDDGKSVLIIVQTQHDMLHKQHTNSQLIVMMSTCSAVDHKMSFNWHRIDVRTFNETSTNSTKNDMHWHQYWYILRADRLRYGNDDVVAYLVVCVVVNVQLIKDVEHWDIAMALTQNIVNLFLLNEWQQSQLKMVRFWTALFSQLPLNRFTYIPLCSCVRSHQLIVLLIFSVSPFPHVCCCCRLNSDPNCLRAFRSRGTAWIQMSSVGFN